MKSALCQIFINLEHYYKFSPRKYQDAFLQTSTEYQQGYQSVSADQMQISIGRPLVGTKTLFDRRENPIFVSA